MPGCTLADFDILIKGDRAPYSVTAWYGDPEGGIRPNASGEFSPDIRTPEWQNAYHTLGDTLSIGDADSIMTIGALLWNALMRGPVRDLWVAARRDVEQERVEGLRLRLDLQAPHVSALPWESLYDPERNTVFAENPKYTLVRIASVYNHVGPGRRIHVQLPLRILVAAPDDPSGVINATREIAEIQQIMDEFGTNVVEMQTIRGDFTITMLRKKLAKFKPNIFHFIGHGEPNGLKLYPPERTFLASTQSLRSTMARAASVKLVVMNACLAGRLARPVPFSGIAEQMMQAGVPAVIGMQYQIRDDVAIEFAHFLYEELLGGACPGIIDSAMSAARSGLYAANPGDFSFGTPILWLNRHDGSIFSMDVEELEPDKQTVAALPVPQVAFALDFDEENAWIDEMVATTEIDRLRGEFAFLRNKWINYVNELRSLLIQLSTLDPHLNSSLYEEKVADYRRFKAALLRVKRLIEDANHKT